MNNNTDNIDQLIGRVLSGEASSADYFALSDWLNQSSHNKKEFSSLKSYWDAEVSFNHFILPEIAVNRPLTELKEREAHRKKRKLRRLFIPYAAAILLFFALSISVYYRHKDSPSAVYYTYVSGDSRAEFFLEDSSKVILNKHSRLTYSDLYGSKTRSVKLEGEAFFDIVKNPQKPFEVQFDDAKISVLGTKFTVKGEKDCDRISATLLSGSIRFESKDQQVMLVPNQQLTFSRSSNTIGIHEVDADGITAWKEGVVKYKSIPFSSLVADLSSRYRVKILIKNQSLLDPSIVVSGSFEETQSVEQILRIVAKSLPIRFKEVKGVYYIE